MVNIYCYLTIVILHVRYLIDEIATKEAETLF